jgi:hypothetical protein
VETEAEVRMVPEPALQLDGKQLVVVVLVETVARVWVQTKEDEAKVDKMAADLSSLTASLVPVRRPTTGCIYGTRFTKDNEMYRVVLERQEPDGVVIVRYSDFGNAERKKTSELVHLPEEMARVPAAAHLVTLEKNTAVKDSQANRDIVEETMEGDLELLFEQGKCVEEKGKEGTLAFSFNR